MADNVTLPPFTAFGDTEIYRSKDGEVHFGLLQDSVIADSTDQLYTVTQAGEKRLDAISHLFYGTSKLWWVIAQVNGIVDPLNGVASKTELRIPTKERLSEAGILSI